MSKVSSFQHSPFSWHNVLIDQHQCLALAEDIITLDRKWLKQEKEDHKLNANIDVVKRALECMEAWRYPFVKTQREKAIHFATCRGEPEIVNLWLESGPIGSISRGLSVIDAAKYGHLEIVRSLLNSGDISLPDRIEAALFAAQGGHLEIVRHLLGSLERADLIPGPQRINLVGFAAKAGALDLVDFLVSNQDNENAQDLRDCAVYSAAQGEKPEIVSLILEKKGAISKSTRGMAVEVAAYHGDENLVNLLLCSGSISDYSRHFAIQKARNQNHHEIANQLTPFDLSFAAKWGYAELVQDLLTSHCIPKEERISAAKKAADGWDESHLQVLRLILLQEDMFPQALPAENEFNLLEFNDENDLGLRNLFSESAETETAVSPLDISDYDRGPILVFAARWGDEKLVEFLLSSNFIPYPYLDHAIRAAKNEGYEELAERLAALNKNSRHNFDPEGRRNYSVNFFKDY